MGWCSGTRVFDAVAKALLSENEELDKKQVLKYVILALQDADWDCEQDSDYWDHPLVREVFMELEPEWFEDEE